MLLVAFFACTPALTRMPGPLDRLGRGATEPLDEWLARRHGPPAADPVGGGRAPAPNAAAKDIVAAATSFVGDPSLVVAGETYRYDCSGLVEATLAKAGVPWTGSSLMLYEAARDAGVLHRRRVPRPGDVAFWDNTYDRDDNGLLDDAVTHSGVVTAVEADGTIDLVHLGSKGVVHLRMNLKHPHERLGPDGTVLNDYLRAKTKADPWGTEYLAGELWSGFASFWAAGTPVAAE